MREGQWGVGVAGVDGKEEAVSGKRRKERDGRVPETETEVIGSSAAYAGSACAEWWDDRSRTYGHQRPVNSVICPFAQDIVPSDEKRTKPRRHAQHWRGVTAVTPMPTPIAVTEFPPSSVRDLLLLSLNPYVLPPAYGVHATQPISSNHLITPYLS